MSYPKIKEVSDMPSIAPIPGYEEEIRKFTELFESLGMPPEDARVMAQRLVESLALAGPEREVLA